MIESFLTGGLFKAGTVLRTTRKNQNSKPTMRSHCHARPISRYSQPWLPSQNVIPSQRPDSPPHSLSTLPKTTIAKAAKRMFVKGACLGISLPPRTLERNKPPVAKPVASQKIIACKWKVLNKELEKYSAKLIP